MTRDDWIEFALMLLTGPLIVGFLWLLWILVAAAVR